MWVSEGRALWAEKQRKGPEQEDARVLREQQRDQCHWSKTWEEKGSRREGCTASQVPDHVSRAREPGVKDKGFYSEPEGKQLL